MVENEHFENQKHEWESALQVTGSDQPAVQVNPKALERLMLSRQQLLPLKEYVDGILAGDITILSKAITLVESSLPAHQKLAQEIIAECIPHSGKALRLGITGVPGAGKSTFIEALGMELCRQDKRVAVLAIDPSSQRSKGSILGDKTRMEELSQQRNAYIRPSASAGTLGGVARKTREAIILCEAAGFDTIIVETVGVGQSETAVYSMVDYFLLVLIGGAGDELQGIKRGIMEMADALVINKADGDNVHPAELAKTRYQSALHLFPRMENGWNVPVTTCSAIEHTSIDKVWQIICDYETQMKGNGFFEQNRNEQHVKIFNDWIDFSIRNYFLNNEKIEKLIDQLLPKIQAGVITPYQAGNEVMRAIRSVDSYYSKNS